MTTKKNERILYSGNEDFFSKIEDKLLYEYLFKGIQTPSRALHAILTIFPAKTYSLGNYFMLFLLRQNNDMAELQHNIIYRLPDGSYTCISSEEISPYNMSFFDMNKDGSVTILKDDAYFQKYNLTPIIGEYNLVIAKIENRAELALQYFLDIVSPEPLSLNESLLSDFIPFLDKDEIAAKAIIAEKMPKVDIENAYKYISWAVHYYNLSINGAASEIMQGSESTIFDIYKSALDSKLYKPPKQ